MKRLDHRPSLKGASLHWLWNLSKENLSNFVDSYWAHKSANGREGLWKCSGGKNWEETFIVAPMEKWEVG